MHSFTNYIFNKAQIFKLQRLLKSALVVFFLVSSTKAHAQCPIANPIPSITICSGTITSIVLTSDQDPLTTYTWTAFQTNVVGATNGAGATISDTLQASDVVQGTVVYTITPHTVGCPVAGIPITASIAVNPTPLAIATPISSTICSGGTSSVALTSDVDPGTSFAWTITQSGESGGSDDAGLLIAQTLTNTGSVLGIATYKITPTADGCVGLAIDAKVKVRPQPSLTLGPNPAVCLGSLLANLTYSSTAGSPNQYSVDYDGIANGLGFIDVVNAVLPLSPIFLVIPPGTPAGVYNAVLSVRNSGNGCPGASYPITITVTAPIPQTIIGTTPLCIGATAIWTSTTAGGTWSSATPLVAAVGALTGLVTGVSAGTSDISYSVSVGGCINTAMQTVTITALVPQTITGITPICIGATTIWSSTTPGGSWSSATPGVAAVDAVSGLVTGVSAGASGITYLVTTAGGCVNTVIRTVTVSAPVPQTITGAASLCVGGTAVWTSTTPGGSWSSATPGVATVDPITGLVTGILVGTSDITYSVTIGGCVNTVMQTVTISTATPQTITGISALCIGSTDVWTGTTPGGSWISATPGVATVDPVSGLVTAVSVGTSDITYSVTTGGCSNTAMQTVTVSAPTPQIITGTTPLCVGATDVWSSTTPGGTWSSATPGVATVGALTGLVSGISAGTSDISYSITIGGCVNTAMKTVTISASTPQIITGITLLCIGATDIWSSTTPGGTWSSATPGVAAVGALTGLVTGISAGTSDISYSVTIGGCVNTAMQTVTISAPTPQTITGTTPLCIGATDIWISTTPGGTWSSGTPGVATVGALTGLVTGISAGTSDISYSVNVGGCVNTALKTVTISASTPQVIIGTTPLCIGAAAIWSSTTPGGTWTSATPGVATVGALTGLVTGISAGTSDISYSVTIGGCVNTAMQTVTISAPTLQTISGTSPICIGATDIWTSTTPGGTWSSATPGVATVGALTGIVTGISAGTSDISYSVNVGGCVNTALKTVTVSAATPQVITGITPLCVGATDIWSSTTPGGTWTSAAPGVATVGALTGLVTGVSAGTSDVSYSVTLGGCVNTVMQTVTISAPIPQIITGITPLCIGGTDTWTSTTPGGAWSSAAPGVAAVDPVTGLVTGISAGTSDITYSITVGGCVNTAMKTVTVVIAAPQIITGITPLCTGITDIWTSTTSGGTWSSATPGVATIDPVTGLVTGITAGTSDITYSVTTVGGCVNTAMKTVTVIAAVAQTITGTTPLCIGATNIWTSTSPGGSWISAAPGIATVDAVTGLVTGVSAGSSVITYSVTIGGCINTAVKTVTVNASPSLVTHDPAAVCSPSTVDLTAGAVTAGTTGSPTFSYYTDAAATLVYGSPSAAVNGIYYIVGSTAGGCSDTAMVTVIVNPTPTLITAPQSICSPATTVDLTLGGVTAGSSPGMLYTYYTNAGATLIYGTPSAAAAGTYYIVGALGGGCSDTSGVTVTINPAPTVLGNHQWVCSPSTVDLTSAQVTVGSTGGLTFSYFSDAGATIPYPTYTAAPDGTYYIVGVTASGCYDTTAIIVTVDPTPTVVTVPQATCFPGRVNLTLAGVTAGSTPGLTYTQWMNAAATTPHITPTLATSGTYYIVGTTGSCGDTTAVTVTINPKPDVLTTNPAIVCAPLTVNLTAPAVTAGSTLGLTYTYYTNAGAIGPQYATPTTASSGNYWIVGTTAAGCSDTTMVTATIAPQPSVITVPQVRCSPATVDLSAGAVTFGSTGGLLYTYFSDPAATLSIGFPAYASEGTGIYYIVGHSGWGCYDTASVTVTINPTPTLVINNPAPVCFPATADLTALAVTAGSTPGLTFTYWVDAAGTNPYATPGAAFNSGIYYIRGTTALGCSVILPVTVIINPKPTVNIANLALCTHDSVALADAHGASSGNTPGLTYTYFTDAGATIPYTSDSAAAGTYYIVGTVPATGCSSIALVTVAILPVVVTVPIINRCYPDTTIDLASAITIGTTPDLDHYTYFIDAALTIPYLTSSAAEPGTYYIVGTTADGCSSSGASSVTFNVNPKPVVSTVDQEVCAPATVNLDLPGVRSSDIPLSGYFYYTNAFASINFPAYTTVGIPGTTGTYNIIGITGFGCRDTASVNVIVDLQPTLITHNQFACAPVSTTDLTLAAITAGSTAGLTLTYFTNSGATISYPTPGAATGGPGGVSYWIVGTNAGGCSDTTRVIFTVNPKPTVVTTAQAICAPALINLTLPGVTAGSTGSLIYTYFTDAASTSPYATPTTAGSGTYYLVGTTAALCSDTTSVLVTINPKPNLVTVSQAVCAPAIKTDLTLPAVTALSSADLIPPGIPFTYFTDPGATSPYATPTAATSGTYYIVGVTAFGCRDTAAVTFAANPKPILNTVPQSICTPDTTFDLTQPASTAGSTSSLTLSYFTDAGATIPLAVPTVVFAGTYYIVGVTAAGCSDTTGITVTVNPKPSVITTSPPLICSPATVDITLPAVTLGSTGSLTYTYFTDSLATNPVLIPTSVSVGTYYIVGLTIAGCSDTTAVNVVSDSMPRVVTVPQAVCTPVVSVDLTLPGVTAGSTAGLSFIIYSDAGATSIYATPTAATAGTYYIVGATLGGCSDTTAVTVTVDPGADAGNITGTSPICIGVSAIYISDGDPGGSWSSSDPLVASVNPLTGQVTALTAGTTFITYTVIGCFGPVNNDVTLVVDPDVNAGAVSGTSPLCISASDQYTNDGDAGGSWSSTNPLVASVDAVTGLVTAVMAGTTDITYTVIGCNGPASSFLTLTVDPDANAGTVSGTSPLCIGASDTYTSDGYAGGSWSSDDVSVASVIAGTGFVTGLMAGTAEIHYIVNGCNGPADALQALTISPDVNAGTINGLTPLCMGSSAPYTSDGDAAGSWSSADPAVATVIAGTGVVTAVSAGATIIAYAVTGCNGPDSAFFPITVNPTNSGTVSGTSPLCIGTTGTYTSDGDPGGSWGSTSPLVASVIAGTGVATALSAGTTDITYTLAGCSSSSILTLTVDPDANAGSVTGTSPLCIGASDTFTSDGDAGGSWSSSSPAIATVNALTGLVTAVTAGTSDITYTVNGCNGPASAFITLTVDPDADAGIVSGTSPLCIGASDTYTSSGDAGGTWSSTNTAAATVIAGTGIVTAVSAGTSNITYTVIGCNGPASSFKTLTVDPDANAGTVSGITPLCIGASDTYTSDGDAGGSWSSTNPAIATVVAGTGATTGVSAGVADITYTVNGCNGPASSFLTLTISQDANAGTVSGSLTVCLGTTDTYTSDGDPGGSWSSSNPLAATVDALTGIVTAVSAGSTDITYTVNGCNGPASASLTITVLFINSGTVSGTTPLCIGGTDTYTSDGDLGGSWGSTNLLVASVNVLTGEVTALGAGTADITYTLAGCSASSFLTLTVDPDVNAGTVSGISPLCIGTSDTYTSDGDAGGSWSSLDALTATVDAVTGLVTGVSAGSTDITYTVNGCNGPASASLTVTVLPINSGTVSGTTPLCIGAFDNFTTDGDLGGTWGSTSPLVASVNAVSGLVTAVSAGTTNITYTLAGCLASSSLTLTVDPDANAGIVSGTTPLCIGVSNTYTSNGDALGSWSSTNPLVASVDAATGLVTALIAGTTDITYTVNGCNGPASSLLTLIVDPDADAGIVTGISPLCISSSDTYTSSGDAGGSWSSTNTAVATVVAGTGLVTAVSAGTSDITYTVNGCNGPASAFITLTVDPDADAGTVSGISPLCIGVSDTYTSNGNPGGSWSSTNTAVATVIAGTGVVTAVSAGTADITYTISSGCNNPVSSFLTLTVTPNANAGLVSGTTPLCIGASGTFTSDGDAGGSWSSTNTAVATVIAGTGVVTTLIAGISDITYTVNGCNGPASAFLTLTVDPDVNSGIVSGTSPLCIGVAAAYSSDGDAGGSWSSTNTLVATVIAGTGVVTAVSAGISDITYTVNGCNGPVSSLQTLTVDPDADAGTVSGTSPLCIGASDNYTSNGDLGGSWSSTDPLVATVIAGTGIVTAISAGTSDITYTVSSGCNNPVSSFLTLTVSPNVNAGIVSGITPLCAGITDTYTSDGDAGGSWSSTILSAATVDAVTGLVTAISAGTADITYTVSGCNGPAAAFLTLTINSTPVVTVTGKNLNCFNFCNGTAIANVIGGTPDYNYNWSSGANVTTSAAADTVKGLCAIGYTVTVTDANGCFDIDSVTITEPTLLSQNITTTHITCNGVCNGSSLSVPNGGTSPYTFAWNTGSVDSVISGLCSGTYTVIVTDSLGCTALLADTILTAAPISANALITNAACGVCDGQIMLSPTGGIVPYTFLWGSGVTTDSAFNLCGGLYSVNITDSIGCSANFSIPISNPGGPTSVDVTSSNISCFGLCDGAVTAVTPIGGTPPYSILWIQGGQTTPTLSGLCAGVYYIQAADSIGCALIDSVTITEPTQVVVNQFITEASCGACDGSISVAPSGGAPPYSVLWSTGSVSDTLTNLCAMFYSVQITDNVGCTQNVAMPLSSLNGPSLITSSVQLLCNNSCNASASVSASGGMLPYNYLWNDGPPATANDTAVDLCHGTYFVQVTDGSSCVSFASVVITNPAPIGFGFANTIDPLCHGSDNGSLAVIPFGGTLPYTFSWSSGGSISDTALSLSAGIYTVTVTDVNGCVSAQTNTLVNPDSLTISNVPTPASCNTIANGAIDVTVGGGTPGYTYQWSGGSILTTQDLAGIFVGSYTITVTDTSGCTIADTINISSTITVLAHAGNDTAFCQPGTMLLSAAGSSANVTGYHWYQIPANTLIDSVINVSVSPALGSTSYYVITDTVGCSNSDTITVTLNPLPAANAGADVTIIAGTSTVIGGNPTGPAGSTYIWTASFALDDNTISNPTANPTATTTYTVTVTTSQGCTSNDIIIITVVADITFANGISPNGDGANDEWIIDNIDLFPNSMVEVYNRWGELLFQSKGYTEHWKGIFKGQLLPVGTYYYIIKLNDPLFPDAYTGPITILR